MKESNMEYRLWNKIVKKYFTARDYERVFLAPNGRVKYFNWDWGVEDITDQVIVEQWTGQYANQNIPPKKIFAGDKVKDQTPGTPFDSGVVVWDPNGAIGWTVEENEKQWMLNSNYDLEVIGTIHDESEASNAI